MSAKRKKALAAINTEGWMMSYADMATILLAMFIVLSTLGKDQTGASLQKGLESWRDSRQTFGLSGVFQPAQYHSRFNNISPRYNLDDEDDGGLSERGKNIDQEEQKFQRFVNELERLFNVVAQAPCSGQATMDFFPPKPLPAGVSWKKSFLTKLDPLLPLLRHGTYRFVVIVRAPLPNESALCTACEEARDLADEVRRLAGLAAADRQLVAGHGQAWAYRTAQRPAATVVVKRIAPR